MRGRGALTGLAAVVAVAAIFLPAVRLDLSGMPRPAYSKAPRPAAAWQVRDWSTAAMLPEGWRTLRGEGGDFAAGMDNLNLGHTLLIASGERRLAVSGIFRLGPYLAAPLLLAVGFFGLAVALALARQRGAAALAAAVAFVCSFFALAGFVWIAVAARAQRDTLRSLGGAAPGGLALQAGLFLLAVALLAFSLLAAREDRAGG
jgi:hypothetical protein